MMKIIGAACLLFLVACQDTGGSASHPTDTVVAVAAVPEAPDTTSLGGAWYLLPVLDSDTVTGKLPWLEFDLAKSKFVGNTGCNTMRGSFWFSKKDSSLSFGDKLATTRMVCPGYNEPAFLKSLHNTARYRLRQGMLTLLGEDNMELSRWKRKSSAPEKTLKT